MREREEKMMMLTVTTFMTMMLTRSVTSAHLRTDSMESLLTQWMGGRTLREREEIEAILDEKLDQQCENIRQGISPNGHQRTLTLRIRINETLAFQKKIDELNNVIKKKAKNPPKPNTLRSAKSHNKVQAILQRSREVEERNKSKIRQHEEDILKELSELRQYISCPSSRTPVRVLPSRPPLKKQRTSNLHLKRTSRESVRHNQRKMVEKLWRTFEPIEDEELTEPDKGLLKEMCNGVSLKSSPKAREEHNKNIRKQINAKIDQINKRQIQRIDQQIVEVKLTGVQPKPLLGKEKPRHNKTKRRLAELHRRFQEQTAYMERERH